jgi:16S rRNA (uracil1498-N3)-methyltransferase
MHRFFIPSEDFHTDQVHIRGKTARQISRVLRLKAGAQCVLLDNLGGEYLVRLETVDSDMCDAAIMERRKAEEPGARLLMMLCLTQREKFEGMLQKCTEVGAAEFLPVISQRSLVQDEADARNKYERWNDILREAAEQSGRGRIPVLYPTVRLKNAVEDFGREYPLRLIPWEGEKQTGLKSVLKDPIQKKVAVLIGPEGGFAEDEVQQAMRSGFQPVTLGRRILRMETAAVVSAALILHELE